MNNTTYFPRVLCVRNAQGLTAELSQMGIDSSELTSISPYICHYLLKLHRVSSPIAQQLDVIFSSAGGRVLIGRERGVNTDLVELMLLGLRKHYCDAIATLKEIEGCNELASDLANVLLSFDDGPVMPDNTENPHPKSRWVFEEMRQRTLVMGILNVTPDSFSDGGQFFDYSAAVRRGIEMVEQGADIIDIGGESTRPGSSPVTVEDEIARVIPVIEELSSHIQVPISIDTYHSATADAALKAGATIVNDISGMAFDPDMPKVVAEHHSPVILMHIKGTPRDMQENPSYMNLMGEVMDYLQERIDAAVAAGVNEKLIIVDPGIGFGKSVEHNLEILNRLSEFRSLGRPILVGVSRKATIGHVLGGLVPEERVEGTAAAVAISISNGANIVRVHDVKEMARVAKMTDAIVRSGS